jgi:hypothetical protein
METRVSSSIERLSMNVTFTTAPKGSLCFA